MLRKCLLALGAAVASGSMACAAPLEAYGKLPNIEQAEVSPSGKLVAYIVTDGDKRVVAVQTVAEHKLLYMGQAGAAKLRDLQWAGDEHLILTMSTARQPVDVSGPRVERSIAFDLSLSKQAKPRVLLEHPYGVVSAMNTIRGRPEIRMIGGKPVVFVVGEHFVANMGQPGLFKVDLATGFAELVDPGGNGAYDWLVDGQGQVLAKAGYDDRHGVWTLKLKNPNSSWRTIEKVAAPIETPDLIGVSRDGKSVLVDIGDDKDGSGWRALSVDSGAWGDRTPESAGESAILDPASDRVIGMHALIGDRAAYTFFDEHDAAIWRSVLKAFPGDLVTLQSWSADRRKIVVRVDSATLGPAYSLVDLDAHTADWLGAEYVDLKAGDVSPVKPVRYKAADGLEISGYLTLPYGREARALPLVVLAHGGPAARDEPGFDWWAQALAAQGYAVLQANFRGSDGFGQEFLAAGYGQWGRKMQTDLSDGVRDLARQGIVDPKRVCIVGGSYGGYAALAGATIDHGVYRCAVSVAGVSDLRALVNDFQLREGDETERFWFRFIGSQKLSDPVMTTYSPLARAAQADVPVLLIHGRDDTVVPIAHSRRMADALRHAGKPVEFVELPGEDHWLSTGATRLQMLQATVAFLAKNNPPN